MSESMRACRKCGKEKSIRDFYKHKRSPDGLSGRCKQCANATQKEWHLKNPGRQRAIDADRRARRLREDGPEKFHEAMRIKMAVWAAANPDKVRARSQRRAAELSDKYIASTFFRMPLEIIPQGLIELKREQIQQFRLLRDLTGLLKKTSKGERNDTVN